ncbi:DNA translocase FtsK [Azorhizobium caulinodans]|uniref:DNA translocase FtsK n=1 Tax=Azorhizobium caulinodans TaxID=7 RepID=UPI002FBD63AE
MRMQSTTAHVSVTPWIANELVPSWLKPFTLDANTRFTRTPEYLLRPRAKAAEKPTQPAAPRGEMPAVPPPAAPSAPQAQRAEPKRMDEAASGFAFAERNWSFIAVEDDVDEVPAPQQALVNHESAPVAASEPVADPVPVADGAAERAVEDGMTAPEGLVEEGEAQALSVVELEDEDALMDHEDAILEDDLLDADELETLAEDEDEAFEEMDDAEADASCALHDVPQTLLALSSLIVVGDLALPERAQDQDISPLDHEDMLEDDEDFAEDDLLEDEEGELEADTDADETVDEYDEDEDDTEAEAEVLEDDEVDEGGEADFDDEDAEEVDDEDEDEDLSEEEDEDFEEEAESDFDAEDDDAGDDENLDDEDLADEDLADEGYEDEELEADEADLEDEAFDEVAEDDAAGELPHAPLPLAATPAPVVGFAGLGWSFYQQSVQAGFGAVTAPAPSAPVAAPKAVPQPVPVPAARRPEAAPVPAVAETLADSDPSDVDGYQLPSLDLLAEPPQVEPPYDLSEEYLEQSSQHLQQILRDFGVRGEIIDANPGPVVTLYELEPAPGTKSSRVIGLSADIARSMSAISARVAVVEGRNVIGIELPNRVRETVWLREMLAGPAFAEARAKLGLCLGKTIGGEAVIADLAKMPHLLVAGTTGSGKSVAINTMILSLLYRHAPEACRLIMIDPKMLELSVYEGIPHLLTPVVTDPKKAIIALKWAVREMEERYRKMSRLGVRNIDGFNARVAEARENGEVITRIVERGFDKETGEMVSEEEVMDLTSLPYIVIIVDEMADLMMMAGKEIEGAIQRLAQMARAAGIHLVMATQRPSVDVITGTIKANFPTRISFQVTSKIDSRTILGEMGAEQLLGQGDMLYMAGGGRIMRVHGPFVSDHEVEKVVAHLKTQGRPEYLDAVTSEEDEEVPAEDDVAVFDKSSMGDEGDHYEQAVAVVLRDRKASTSYIQRRLQIGYNKAASLMERMEQEGIVGPANHAGKREILASRAPAPR